MKSKLFFIILALSLAACRPIRENRTFPTPDDNGKMVSTEYVCIFDRWCWEKK